MTWRRWADFDTGRPLRPWLAGIAFKVASEHLKRRRRWEPRAWLDPPDQAPAGEELLAATRARALAARSLAALEERQRALIVLHDLDGVPMREIAAMLSVPAVHGVQPVARGPPGLLRRGRSGAARAVAARPGARADRDVAAAGRRAHAPPAAPSELRRRSLSRLRGLAAAARRCSRVVVGARADARALARGDLVQPLAVGRVSAAG